MYKLAATLLVTLSLVAFPSKSHAIPFDYTLDDNSYLTAPSIFDVSTLWTCLTGSTINCAGAMSSSNHLYLGFFDLNNFLFIEGGEAISMLSGEGGGAEQVNVINSLSVEIGVRDDSGSFWDFGERGIMASAIQTGENCWWDLEVDTSRRTCDFNNLPEDYAAWNNVVGFWVVPWINDFRMDFVRVSGDYTPVNQVPEPATLALFGLGLAGIGFSRRRKA